MKRKGWREGFPDAGATGHYPKSQHSIPQEKEVSTKKDLETRNTGPS